MFKTKFAKFTLICVCIFLIFFIYFQCEHIYFNQLPNSKIESVKLRISHFTPKEKDDLTNFLKEALHTEDFGYTLIKKKPMSICVYFTGDQDLPKSFAKVYNQKKALYDSIERGRVVLEQYNDTLSQKKYKLIKFHNNHKSDWAIAGLLHVDLCKKQIQKHLAAFQTSLNQPFSTDEIFDILADPNHKDFYTIVENHYLLGLLLGFGENNAFLFAKKLRDQLTLFKTHWFPWETDWFPPTFVCDPTTDETKKLKKIYSKARKELHWTYYNRDFLETTLALFD